ncbi:MAG TPA: Mut7-C RNAse domain-containing protein [Streptosporangiaceae bacterium]|nr:Mut7-C RNAse domain-containing protein [Streptosporangiaceae bacterium]
MGSPEAPELTVHFAAGLRFFLAPRHRGGQVRVPADGISSLGHVVESLGVPLPEAGALRVNGQPVTAAYRPSGGDVAEVAAVARPQPLPSARFILDVHLGTLARRMRLVGIDTAYANDLDDDTLIDRANTGRRVLLTQDRGLLRRRKLWLGAYVRGAIPDEQLRDVLERFAPALAPWTRCLACNGPLELARKADVEDMLKPGTRRTYQVFSRCTACGHLYWRGAHGSRLEAVVDAAMRTVGNVSPASTRRREGRPGGDRTRM